MDIEYVKKFLAEYDGEEISVMEVCGSHTSAVAKNGIPSMISPKINLISGPGCPVCVTPTAYIDKLIEIYERENTCIVTFGDLMRVPGSSKSLRECVGARVKMVYSPMEVTFLAKAEPDTMFVFAAIGFETTTPVYALLLDTIVETGIKNIKLLTALKTMPEVIGNVCESGSKIGGFIAPGHVAVVTGSKVFEELAAKYGIPFAVAGFTGENILCALYAAVKNRGTGKAFNLYKSVVSENGNVAAKKLIDKYFEKGDAVWRGMGNIKNSGRFIKKEFEFADAGSRGLDNDDKDPMCSCDKVVTGKMKPYECKLFGKACMPIVPKGACMVSEEGSCFSYFVNGRKI